MALVLADRVQQTGTANTTVSFTLSGSVPGFQSFSVIGDTNTTYYAATDTSGNWETGVGTYSTTGPTLTRTTILSSSNSGSAVTFSGTVNVFVTYPSSKSVEYEATGGVVITDASTNDALRITQTGSGKALLVEDSASPDSTPFVIDANGRVNAGSLDNYATPVGTPIFQTNATSGALSSIALNSWQAGVNVQSRIYLQRADSSVIGDFTNLVDSGDNLGSIHWTGADGVEFIEAASINAAVDGTPGTSDMPGRLVFSTTADGASTPTERMRINSAGQVGIGITPPAGFSFRIGKDVTGATSGFSLSSRATIQSDVTTAASMYDSVPSTAATAFTLATLNHYQASQGTIGAGSSVTNQYGFNASSSLSGATNNYGFYGSLSAGTGRYNFYAAGTAENYFAGTTTFASNVNISGLTASKVVFSDASDNLTSTGTVGVDQGGTGQTTYTNGELLIGNTTGNTLTKSTLTAGSGIFITNGTGSITIEATAVAPDVQTFTSSGTWTKPSTGQFVRIQMWGGGGGGSRTGAALANIGAGGGGGYFEITVPIADMGSTATVTVGAAGVGRTASTGSGTNGGNSAVTLGNGSIFYVSGGLGAVNDNFGGDGGNGGIVFSTTAVGLGGAGASSTVAAGPGYSYGGGGGGTATNSTGGKGGYGGGGGTRGAGAGGTSLFGGAGGNATVAGTQPGGGGGASSALNTNATNGGAGQVIITTY